jgi:hypothetical protein
LRTRGRDAYRPLTTERRKKKKKKKKVYTYIYWEVLCFQCRKDAKTVVLTVEESFCNILKAILRDKELSVSSTTREEKKQGEKETRSLRRDL